MIKGLLDWISSLEASSITVISGTDRLYLLGAMGLLDVVCRATSSGNSIRTAPGFSDLDIRTAFLTISGIVSGLNILVAHLVTGLNMLTVSII